MVSKMKRVGLVINPIAGMGGRVGLKGTDGVVKKAIELGATPQSPNRAISALTALLDIKDKISIVTCSGDMGENEATAVGLRIDHIIDTNICDTSNNDTINAAIEMVENHSIDLLIFAGGDGTARDIYNAIGNDIVVIGIPAGVKIHSPVYAANPQKSGELAVKYLCGQVNRIKEVEVIDIDEDSYRKGIVKTHLYGYMKIPFLKNYTQNRKMGTPINEHANQNLISLDVIDNMCEDTVYLIGPGSTTRPILENLQLKNTLLGFDAILNREILKKDVNENDILDIINRYSCKLILTPTGGQGYILGRGNQQISPKVIQKLGKENIIIIATKEKLTNLRGRPLIVDTGNITTDNLLKGYYKVITGYKEVAMYKLDA